MNRGTTKALAVAVLTLTFLAPLAGCAPVSTPDQQEPTLGSQTMEEQRASFTMPAKVAKSEVTEGIPAPKVKAAEKPQQSATKSKTAKHTPKVSSKPAPSPSASASSKPKSAPSKSAQSSPTTSTSAKSKVSVKSAPQKEVKTPKKAVKKTNYGVNPTMGTGGKFLDRLNVNYKARGEKGQYHIYASGIDTSKPIGVLFHFHGDKGYEFKNPEYKYPGIVTHAKNQNMIVVAMGSPNNSTTWWDDFDGNGDYARALMVREVFNKYNIDRDKVWLVGYSGGAEFITYELLAEHSDLFTGGGAVLFGGGGFHGKVSKMPTDAFKSKVHLTWVTGLDDDMDNSTKGWSAIDDVRRGHSFYTRLGFKNTNLFTPSGVDHYGYNEPRTIGKLLDNRY